jgi:(S)-sulfolactate dehydrogenase
MAALMRIVVSEFMHDSAVATLGQRHAVLYDKTLVDRRAELIAQLADAAALIVGNRTQVDETLLASAPRLKVVGRLGVGLDNIDTTACLARGITVIPATGANAQAVAEYVIGVAMLLLRTAYQSTAAVADGSWPRGVLGDGREIAGKTLGLVGFGGIGRLTAQLGRALSMNVVGFDPQLPPSASVWAAQRATPRSLEQLLAQADVVSLHVPLTPATRNLLDAPRIALMKPDAILINTARGGVVDEAAVAAALRSGRLAGAALDVFDLEPLPAGSPLAGCPHLILTPHIAGQTRESRERVATLVAEKVAATLAGP